MLNYEFKRCQGCKFYGKKYINGTSMIEEFCIEDHNNAHSPHNHSCKYYDPINNISNDENSDNTINNSKYIRSLSDEELAVFLAQCIYDMNDYPNFVQEVYDWLHKPIELNSNAYSFAELAKKYIKEVH